MMSDDEVRKALEEEAVEDFRDVLYWAEYYGGKS